jgi:hypothetical protein
MSLYVLLDAWENQLEVLGRGGIGGAWINVVNVADVDEDVDTDAGARGGGERLSALSTKENGDFDVEGWEGEFFSAAELERGETLGDDEVDGEVDEGNGLGAV